MTGPLERRGFLRGLAAIPLMSGGVTLIASPTKAAEPLTPESYIREIRAIENYSFVLLKCQPSGPSRSPYWYYIDGSDKTTCEGRDAFLDIEHRYRKAKTMEFHDRVRDRLVADLKECGQ
jgi:hypothetical protein